MLREPALIIDAATARLHAGAWSAGQMAYQLDGRMVWQVYAHRDGQRIIVRTNRQHASWLEAVRLASRHGTELRSQ